MGSTLSGAKKTPRWRTGGGFFCGVVAILSGPIQNLEDSPLGMSSVPQSSLPTRAFLLTVSVKGDISDDCVKEIVKHIDKTTDYSYVVTEFGENDKRHLHAVMLYKDPRTSRKIQDNVWQRFVKPFHPDSIGRIAVKVQVCPGNKWYDEYLQKEQAVTVHHDAYDREAALDYFPTQAVQEALMATHEHKGVACAWLEQDVITWSGSTFENTPEGALMYLNHRMYVVKNMVPIACPRKLTEKSLMYWKYRNQVISPTERELWLLKQLQDGPSYDVPTIRRGPESSAPPSI